MDRRRTNTILWKAPAALLALAASVPLAVACEGALPATPPQARVEQLADCVQRAARAFCRVPAPFASAPVTREPRIDRSIQPTVECGLFHARLLLLDEAAVDLPPPVL